MFELSLLICGLAVILCLWRVALGPTAYDRILAVNAVGSLVIIGITLHGFFMGCLLYTSPSPRDRTRSRMPSSA